MNTFTTKCIQRSMFVNYLFLFFILLVFLSPGLKSQKIDSTQLPLVNIHMLHHDSIVDEPKRTGIIDIVYNGKQSWNHPTDKGNVYSGYAGVEIRGAYSASLPQKPYGFETRDSVGNNKNVPLLTLPSDNDWILLANYNDKSFVRNSLPFWIFREMGHYAPRTLHCEVIVNDDYQGIYVLTEKIKVGKNRVAIANLKTTDIVGDELSGGYIFKTDYYDSYNSWQSSYPSLSKPDGKVYFVYQDPKPEELTYEQKTYLKNFTNAFEKALYGSNFSDYRQGYLAYIDLKSFVDYFIVSEVSRNVDAYKKSRYLFKDKDSKGGLLNSGPVWDFDWAFKNINECIFSVTDGSGWAYKSEETCKPWPLPPSWMIRLMQDSYFVNQVKTFYTTYRQTILSEDHINNYIDSIANLLSKPAARHFTKWPILGKNLGAPETDPPANSFSGEMQKLKTWIHLRLEWLDANMPGELISTATNTEIQKRSFRVFPNPVSDGFYCETMMEMERLEMFNVSGAKVKELKFAKTTTGKVNVNELPNGIYFIRITMVDGEVITHSVLVNH